MLERRVGPPPLVTVLAVFFYLGGGLVIVYALIGMGGSASAVSSILPVWGQVLYGAFYVGLARALQCGWRWARRIALAVCWVGIALAMVFVLLGGVRAAVEQGVWPVIYLALLTRPSVRDWFTPSLPPAAESPAGGL